MHEKIYIIAEAACECLGSEDKAKRLIDVAIAAGADAVKFQLFYPDELGEKAWRAVERYSLSCDDLWVLKRYAERGKIDWLCSAFGITSLHSLADMGLLTIKIPSPCLTNYRMLDVAGELFPNIMLSTGLHNLQEVKDATRYLNKWLEPESVAVLQCTSAYPCPLNAVNLRAMVSFRNETLKAGRFGISDHTLGLTVPIAATALGADIIEKHLTLSRAHNGPDACCSLEPLEFMGMVQAIRDTEEAMGAGIKVIENVEVALLWRKRPEEQLLNARSVTSKNVGL